MKFLTLSKFLLILMLPFLLFLLALDFGAFDNIFFREKFSEYQVEQKIPQAIPLHEKVVSFITGKNNEIPSDFNEREKQHLWDVRSIIRISSILLYALIILFILLLLISAFILKVNNSITNFVGKVLVFGGFLTVILAALLFFLIYSDFSATFESFHMLLFQQGTYSFDPSKEIIINLYPEQLFMDLGIRISKWVIIASSAIILLGAFFVLMSKKKK